jgi:AcrR family transcriptional regulator
MMVMVDKVSTAEIDQNNKRAPELTGRAADILALSIELFNNSGIQEVSTNKISAELGISPGNLHYHFKTKVLILTAAYEQMEFELRAAVSEISFPLTFEKSVIWQENVLSCLWRYRFFFSGLDFFMQRAPKLLARFTKFQDWMIECLAKLHEDRINDGTMRPVFAPNTTLQFAANVWMLWLAWIRWEMINTGISTKPGEKNDRAVIYRLLKHNFSLNSAYYGKRASEAISALIEARAP